MTGTAKKPFMLSLKRIAGVVVPLCVLAAALFILHRHLNGITWQSLRDAFGEIDHVKVHLSILATIISFLGLAAYDVFAARIVAPGRMSLWSAAFAGLTGSAVSNTLGFHLLTGGAVRYRIFRRWGLQLGDISRITALSMGGLALGYASIITAALLFRPFNPNVFHPMLANGAPYLGVVCAFIIAAFFWWLAHKPRSITVRGWILPFPNATSAMQQMAIGFVEMGAAMMALYVLVPADLAPALPAFAMIYIGMLFMGVASHAPGGIGVFEAGMMASMGAAGRSDMLAALLVYRAIYNLTPFTLGVMALLIREIWRRFFNSTADIA